VLSGATNTYTLTISGGSASNGGLDVSAVGGTFTAGTGSKVSGGEITQTGGLAGATKSWTFSWTAPTVTTITNFNMYGAGIDSFSGGTATIILPIMVSPAAGPPHGPAATDAWDVPEDIALRGLHGPAAMRC